MSVGVYEKKLIDFASQLEELGDEFSANDDGDLELRDVHEFLMESIKLI